MSVSPKARPVSGTLTAAEKEAARARRLAILNEYNDVVARVTELNEVANPTSSSSTASSTTPAQTGATVSPSAGTTLGGSGFFNKMDDFWTTAKVGEGAYGEVFEAEHRYVFLCASSHPCVVDTRTWVSRRSRCFRLTRRWKVHQVGPHAPSTSSARLATQLLTFIGPSRPHLPALLLSCSSPTACPLWIKPLHGTVSR
jgi:hypothetical protein